MDAVIALISMVVSGLVAYFYGRYATKKENAAAKVKQRLDAMKVSQEVRDEVEILDDTGLADRASKWLRK
jgi:hypothetical protein